MPRYILPVALLLLIPLAAAGGDIKTVVRKDAIIISPMDPQGMTTISGPPGCVLGMFPIQIMAKNKKTDIAVGGAVAPDGSFMIRIPAGPKNKIKLTFTGANGKDKKVTVKAPKTISLAPVAPLAAPQVRHSTVIIPQGRPAAPMTSTSPVGSIQQPPPADMDIIEGERNLEASGVIE